MTVSKAYVKHVNVANSDIRVNFDRIGGASSWIAAQKKENCPNSLEGTFLVTGENGYRAEDTHLAAALVRISCVYNARNIWHVKENGKKVRVFSS